MCVCVFFLNTLLSILIVRCVVSKSSSLTSHGSHVYPHTMPHPLNYSVYILRANEPSWRFSLTGVQGQKHKNKNIKILNIVVESNFKKKNYNLKIFKYYSLTYDLQFFLDNGSTNLSVCRIVATYMLVCLIEEMFKITMLIFPNGM